jgi:hypothetical protein
MYPPNKKVIKKIELSQYMTVAELKEVLAKCPPDARLEFEYGWGDDYYPIIEWYEDNPEYVNWMGGEV